MTTTPATPTPSNTTPSNTTTPSTAANLYLTQKADDHLVLNIPSTKYNLHLVAASEVTPNPQGRLTGTIHITAATIDLVSRGGSYIEPLNGRPRRIQGTVAAHLPNTNDLILIAHKTPFLITLPEHLNAADYPPNTRLAVDAQPDATFEQTD